jgi:hypothetical protein
MSYAQSLQRLKQGTARIPHMHLMQARRLLEQARYGLRRRELLLAMLVDENGDPVAVAPLAASSLQGLGLPGPKTATPPCSRKAPGNQGSPAVPESDLEEAFIPQASPSSPSYIPFGLFESRGSLRQPRPWPPSPPPPFTSPTAPSEHCHRADDDENELPAVVPKATPPRHGPQANRLSFLPRKSELDEMLPDLPRADTRPTRRQSPMLADPETHLVRQEQGPSRPTAAWPSPLRSDPWNFAPKVPCLSLPLKSHQCPIPSAHRRCPRLSGTAAPAHGRDRPDAEAARY